MLQISNYNEIQDNILKLTDEEIIILNSLLSDDDTKITAISELCQILNINENTLYNTLIKAIVKLNGLNIISAKQAIKSILARDILLYNSSINFTRNSKK